MTSKQLLNSISRASCLAMLIAILVFSSAFRAISSRLEKVTEKPVNLPIALKYFPAMISDWSGKDVNLPESVLKTAGNDDYLNRLYTSDETNNWVNLYIAYSARPRTMLGHRPDICYVGAGWVRDSTEKSTFLTQRGQEIPCLLHRFHRPTQTRDELVVLNFYVVNGLVSNDETLFSGLQWRTPNIQGNIARYVAQVQISSVLENTVRKSAADFVESVLEYLPDQAGNVKIAASALK